MNENAIGNILAVLYILQIPLLIAVCVYNAKTVKKKDRAAAPFVWLPIGLCVAAFFGFTLLWIRLDISLGNEYSTGFLTLLLILCGHAASVLIAKRALSGEDKRNNLLARSLRPEHFANGRAFSRPAFDQWILESRKSLRKALIAYLCSVAGGILLSLLFSEVGGFGGNIVAVLCIFAGLIAGGIFSKKAGMSAENSAVYLGISSADVAAAKRHLKNGTFAWCEDEPAAPDRDGETP